MEWVSTGSWSCVPVEEKGITSTQVDRRVEKSIVASLHRGEATGLCLDVSDRHAPRGFTAPWKAAACLAYDQLSAGFCPRMLCRSLMPNGNTVVAVRRSIRPALEGLTPPKAVSVRQAVTLVYAVQIISSSTRPGLRARPCYNEDGTKDWGARNAGEGEGLEHEHG